MRLPQAALHPARPPAGAATKTESALTDWGRVLAVAAPLLALTWFILPLRLGEVLQIAGITRVARIGLFDWIAGTPNAAPLNFLAEFPFLAALGNNRFSARIVSFLFAIVASYLFLRWAKRIPLQRPYLAFAAFLLLPLHYMLATRGQPFEQGLFFSLAATIYFFHLVAAPSVLRAVSYTALLTICLYTSPYSFLPAIGLLIGLFAFVIRAHERRAAWFLLPATAVPVLLFLPYLVWAQPHAAKDWLFEPASFPDGAPAWQQPVYALVNQGWAACGLAFLCLWGLVSSLWSAVRFRRGAIARRRILVCCSGAVIVTIVLALCLDAANGRAFRACDVLWIAPALIVLVFAGCERVGWLLKSTWPVLIGATALLVLSAASDITYLAAGPPDIGRVARLTTPELTGDSCVVFVSERYSESLFLVFQPQLAARECMNFFHHKIVLASHPYVLPNQQSDAESFFRALNFVQRKRIHAGGGKIVVMQQK